MVEHYEMARSVNVVSPHAASAVTVPSSLGWKPR